MARLATGQRGCGRVVRRLPGPTSVKDAIEAAGVPHCEIGRVVDDGGGARGLEAPVADGDVLAVSPVRQADPGDARFLCDGHLGALARLLRTLGFDTAWRPQAHEAEIARRGLNEDRIVLSGHRALLKRRELVRAMLVIDDDPDRQAAAVVRRYGLASRARPFGRCPRCNGLVSEVAKADVAHRIPPRTAAWLDVYYVCADCDQLYWEGTHVTALRARLDRILDGT
ncbi:MAG: twitching motility protein PilT [bacterium]|nr:twitching motility protein PilT [bacterium]